MFRTAAILMCVTGALVGSVWFAGWTLPLQAAGVDSNTTEPTQQEIDEVRATFQQQRKLLEGIQGITSVEAQHEPQVNETAAFALGRIGYAAVAPLANELQRSTDPEVRFQATVALAFIGPDAESAVPQLVSALKDENVAVRRGAARALGQIGPGAASAVPSLIQALQDTAYIDQPKGSASPAANAGR